MQLDDAWELANRRVQQLLPFTDWTVRFDRSRWRAGATDFETGEIILSMTFARHYTEWEFNQIVLHEIAHARVGPNHGHGREWQREAYRLGYDGGKHVDELPKPEAPMWKVAGFLLAMIYVIGTTVASWLGWTLFGILALVSFAYAWTRHGPIPSKYAPPIIKNKRNL